MACDVISLDGCCAASTPLTGEIEVVSALAADMAFADMVVERFSRIAAFAAALPLTCEIVDSSALCRLHLRRLLQALLLCCCLHSLRNRLRC